ncbi:MAG: hypothetical protein ACYDAG_04780 [Chloroflexota bacterium]
MYLYALFITAASMVLSEGLGIGWQRLLTVPPLHLLLLIGSAGEVLARACAVLAVYGLAFTGLSLILTLVGAMEGRNDMLRHAAEHPSWWAHRDRPELVWQGLRPYCWLALTLPIVLLQVVTYLHNGRVEWLGELLALELLAFVTAAQTLHPFRWRLGFFPALPGLVSRIGLLTDQRAPALLDVPPERPQRFTPAPGAAEEWTDWFELQMPGNANLDE